MVYLTKKQAEGFYAVHKERPFYADLVKFMTGGPVIIQVLSGEGAIAKNREIWVQLTQKLPLLALFVLILLPQSMLMQFMVLIASKLQRKKSVSFLNQKKFAPDKLLKNYHKEP